LFDDKSLTGSAANYLANLDIGIPEPDAFKQAFPFDKPGLDKALHALIAHQLIHVRTVTYGQGLALDNAPIAPMTAAQADAELVRLTFMLGWSKEIHALAADALKENPADPAVRALSVRIFARDDKPQDISDLVDSLLAAGAAGDVQVRIDVASTLINQDTSKEHADQAFALLDGIVHTDSPPLEAVALWAFAAERSGIDPAKRVAALKSASARAPHKTRLLRDLAVVSETQGDTAAARDYYNRIILVSDLPEERLQKN
jgi:hypothetical protein